ncbi:MAG: flagellar hook-associated protein FlgK [Planctomycetota bacterium]|nr:flagellar hook-associated protein FlgK [Planctomycetota bacterium]
MSLTTAFNIGRSALQASQLGIQVASNNMANAGTIGYSRQIGRLQSLRGDRSIPGIMVGGGVIMRSVLRQVDDGIEARLRGATADQAFAGVRSQISSQIEDALGELGENDLSSQLSSFFRAWSERANQSRTGASVVQQGEQLATFIRRLRSDLSDQSRQVASQVGAGVDRANQLLEVIAGLNSEISQAEVAGTIANTLRDQRDQSVRELSEIMDVTVVARGQQGIDVLAGSIPVILGSQARPLSVRREADGAVSVVSGENESRLDVRSGTLGALLEGQGDAVDATIDRLDSLASQVIFQVNRLHSTGARSEGLRSASGTLRLTSAERGLALNDPSNTALASLPFAPTNGGFMVHVRQQGTGATQAVRINVDLDGLTSAGTPGTADDTSAEDIRAQLAAIPGLAATFTSDGRLDIRAADGFDFSFSDDTSGALAVLGVNSYFTGTDGASIAVRSDLSQDASLLMGGRIVDGQFVENGTALEVAGLQSRSIDALAGRSILDHWRDGVQLVGSMAASARSNAEAAAVVREGLEAQRSSVSGVSIDEEALNLLDFQRQYQAAARIVSVAEQLTQTLLELV